MKNYVRREMIAIVPKVSGNIVHNSNYVCNASSLLKAGGIDNKYKLFIVYALFPIYL